MKKIPRQVPTISEEDQVNLTHRQKKLKYLKTRRTLRKIEIMLARFRVFAKLFAVVFIILGIKYIISSPQWYLNDYIFAGYSNNDYLEIEGNKIVSQRQILHQLRDIKLPDKPIYLLDVKPVEKAILKLTPIKKVYIRRFWNPARLKIVIDEKKPILSISPSPIVSPIAVFTEDISIIGKEFLPINYPKDIYLVLTYDDYAKWSGKHVKYLAYLSELIESVTKKKLKYLDIRNPDDVYAQLDDIKLRLGELDRTVFVRTKRVGAVLSEAIRIKETIEYIDLRWDKSIAIKLKNKEIPKAIKEEDDEKSKKKKVKETQKPKAKPENNSFLDANPKPNEE